MSAIDWLSKSVTRPAATARPGHALPSGLHSAALPPSGMGQPGSATDRRACGDP